MWGHAKLAGILTEVTRASASRISKDHYIVVVGIGINLQKAEHLSQLFNRPVADWSQISQTVPTVSTHGPEHLVAVIAHQWWKQLNEVTTHGFKNLISLYQSVDYLYRLPIHILNNGQITNSGIAAGINMQGQLLLQTGSQMYPISVGEISVRPQNETKP